MNKDLVKESVEGVTEEMIEASRKLLDKLSKRRFIVDQAEFIKGPNGKPLFVITTPEVRVGRAKHGVSTVKAAMRGIEPIIEVDVRASEIKRS